jgi:hypothetical protein
MASSISGALRTPRLRWSVTQPGRSFVDSKSPDSQPAIDIVGEVSLSLSLSLSLRRLQVGVSQIPAPIRDRPKRWPDDNARREAAPGAVPIIGSSNARPAADLFGYSELRPTAGSAQGLITPPDRSFRSLER